MVKNVFQTKKLDLSGYTPFQLKVYAVLRKVPAGKTVTYGELAKRAGYPGAARAVGTAMRKNRLPIVIPCHRVIPVASRQPFPPLRRTRLFAGLLDLVQRGLDHIQVGWAGGGQEPVEGGLVERKQIGSQIGQSHRSAHVLACG